MTAALPCPRCRKPLFRVEVVDEVHSECEPCGRAFRFVLFPSYGNEPAPAHSTPAPALPGSGAEVEATCFYHPGKAAAQVCGACGAFLCQVCDLELDQEHLCPRCFEAKRTKGSLKSTVQGRLLDDGIALGLALVPCTLFFYIVTPLSAPAALFFGIRSLRRKSSGPVPRGQARAVIAILLATLEIVGMIVLVLGIIATAHRKAPHR